MKEALYKLCNERSIHIPLEQASEFLNLAKDNKIEPRGIVFHADDPSNPQPGKEIQGFYLDEAITAPEAFVIADRFHLKGEIERLISLNYTPFQALCEWDLV